jgi:hypothetical protein
MRGSKVIVSEGCLIFKRAVVGSKEEGRYLLSKTKFDFEADRNILYRFFYGTTYKIYVYPAGSYSKEHIHRVAINKEDMFELLKLLDEAKDNIKSPQ